MTKSSLQFEDEYQITTVLPASHPSSLPIDTSLTYLHAVKKENKQKVFVRKIFFNNWEGANDVYVELYNLKRLIAEHDCIVPIYDILIEHLQEDNEETKGRRLMSYVYVITPRYPEGTMSSYLEKQHDNKQLMSGGGSGGGQEMKIGKLTGFQEESEQVRRERARSYSISAAKNMFNAVDDVALQPQVLLNMMVDLASALSFLHLKGYAFSVGHLTPHSIVCSDLYTKFKLDVVNSAIARTCKEFCFVHLATSTAYISPEIRVLRKALTSPISFAETKVTTTGLQNSQKNDVWSMGVLFFQILTLMDENTIHFMFSNMPKISEQVQQQLSGGKYNSKIVKYIKKMIMNEPRKRYTATKVHIKLEKLRKSQEKEMRKSRASSLRGSFSFTTASSLFT